MITSAVAIIGMKQSTTLLDADKAANQVAEEIRYARQIALDDRRNVLIEFIDPGRIKITRQDSPTPTVLYDMTRTCLRVTGSGFLPELETPPMAMATHWRSTSTWRTTGPF